MPRNELNVLCPRAFPLGAVPRGLRTRIPPAAPRTLFDIERPVTSFRLLLAAGLSFTLMTGPSPALLAATPRLDAAYQVATADTQTAKKRTTSTKKSSASTKKSTTTKKAQTTRKSSKSTAQKSAARKSTSTTKAPVRKSLQTEKEKSKAESEKASVDQRLVALQKELSEKEARQEAADRALKKADQAISEANRRLRDLKTERRTVERQLQNLKRDGRNVSEELQRAESLVGQIARAQYVHSRRESWQTLLEGSNPNTLTLEAAQLRYLARAQTRAVAALEDKHRKIRSVADETQSRQSELARIARDEEKSRKELLSEKKDRQAAASKLKKEIASQQAAIDKLTKDQARLGSLVASIDKRLTAERAAEAAAQKKAEEEAKKKNSRPVVRQPAPGTNFAKLKGKLSRPVAGRVVARFGSQRTGSAKWQGLLIRAPEGAEVVACAPGTVVFADWLRGYGNLVIVDHGNTYLSVYANNESIFKNVGDRVKQGETISSVGASGGDDEPGLYFEIRRGGKPVDPSPWLSAK